MPYICSCTILRLRMYVLIVFQAFPGIILRTLQVADDSSAIIMVEAEASKVP